MDISVVIPTYNRKKNVISLLNDLHASVLSAREVIVVDGGTDKLMKVDIEPFEHLKVRILYPPSASVCIQRNIGIRAALAPWIFLCDDDMEVPKDYLIKIRDYILAHPEAGAVSGQVLQKNDNCWKGFYPVRSSKELFLRYFFGLGIWGKIECGSDNCLMRCIKSYYEKRGNHIAASGWPVITDISEGSFIVPVFGLGASVILKELLLEAPYEERLDRHGIGDHYGIAADLSPLAIHVMKNACVYHHHAPADRLQRPLQYYRRALALDYFVQSKEQLSFVKRSRLLWSLLGNMLIYLAAADRLMTEAAWKTLWRIAIHRNPYLQTQTGYKEPVEPLL